MIRPRAITDAPMRGRFGFALTLGALAFLYMGASASAVTPAEVRAEIAIAAKTAAVVASGARLDIGAIDLSRVPDLAAAQRVSADIPAGIRGDGGRVSVRLQLSRSAQNEQTVWVRAEIAITRERVVVLRPVARGAALTGADIGLRRGPVATGDFTDVDQVVGLLARRALKPKSVLVPRLLTAPPAIKIGAALTAIMTRGAFTIRVPGAALSQGALGDDISVRLTPTGRVVRARVLSPALAQVQ